MLKSATGLIVGLALLTAWLVFDPHPWQVIAIPLLSLICFQVIAFRCASAKVLFQLTDYIYYLVVGGVVGVGSLYVLNGAAVNRFNSLFELQSLTQELASIQHSIPSLTKSLEQMGEPPANDEFLASCLTQDLQNRLRAQMQASNSRTAPLAVTRLDLCRGYFQRQAQRASLQRELDHLVRRQHEIPGRVEELKKGIEENSTPLTALPPFKELTLRFLFIPTLVLIGITMKLGKTTYLLQP
jgi:hypothetical protein